MKTRYLLAIILPVVGFAAGYFVYGGEATSNEAETAVETNRSSVSFVAPGVVEAVSEEIEVGSEIPGKIKEILVNEGDEVLKGETIAILENDDLASTLESAKTRIGTLERQKATAIANIKAAKADKDRIANGSRRVERTEAKRIYEETLPAVRQAQSELARREKLFASGDVSKEEVERARENLESLKRKSATKRESFNVVNAPARADDLAKADALIELESARVREFDGMISEAESDIRNARARFEKSRIISPITGVVLRKRKLNGESVSPESSLGIVSVADVSELRIRVDVDEKDVARVRDGQRVYSTAPAFGEKRFTGEVVRVGSILGKKNFRTDEPREKVDTKVLEVLVRLDPGHELPLGLRVDVYFEK